MTLIYTLGQPCNAKSDTQSDTHLHTCSFEVIHGIEGNNDISIVHPSIMVDPVLLEGPGVEYSNLHVPHAGDGIEDHFVPCTASPGKSKFKTEDSYRK